MFILPSKCKISLSAHSTAQIAPYLSEPEVGQMISIFCTVNLLSKPQQGDLEMQFFLFPYGTSFHFKSKCEVMYDECQCTLPLTRYSCKKNY